jgi:hypothetical protein
VQPAPQRRAPSRPAPAPQAPQLPALQRPERFVERCPAPPPKVDPITAALQRDSSDAPRGSGGHGKAPGARRGKQQESKGGHALAWWRVQAQRAGSVVSCVNIAMVQLQHVSGADVEADAGGVMRDALQLLQSDVDGHDERLASFLDALGSAVQAHEGLAAAIAADADASAQVAQALERAAQQEATYTNAFCTAQMATAQEKLRQYCARFWRELARTGLQHAGPREVATVVHRMGVLAGEQGAPAPAEGLWDVLEAGIVSTAEGMDAQAVSNCWHAFAKLAREPHHAVDAALSGTLLRVCKRMVPQDASNMLWAYAKLGLSVRQDVREALLAAVARTASLMREQEVANTWWAIAKLGWRLRGQLVETLLAAAQLTSKDMNDQAVSNVWYALALLGVRPQGAPRDALVTAAVRVSAAMEPQGVTSTLWALAKLGLPLSDELQAALLDAVQRVSEQMNGHHASNALWALGELDLQPSAKGQRALCDALLRSARAAPLKPEGAYMAQRGVKKLRWPVSAELERALSRINA